MAARQISKCKLRALAAIAIPLSVLGAGTVQAQKTQTADPMKTMRPVTDEMLVNPDAGHSGKSQESARQTATLSGIEKSNF